MRLSSLSATGQSSCFTLPDTGTGWRREGGAVRMARAVHDVTNRGDYDNRGQTGERDETTGGAHIPQKPVHLHLW